jgi:flavin reductase (DIM6/NTAB) family NADH-FMN oxidoreductase RutF
MSRGNGIATFCGFVQSVDEEGHVLVVCSVVGVWIEETSDSLLLKLFLVD